MAILTPEQIKQIVAEIQQDAETSRRAEMHRRHKIYLDGGKQYLIEQLTREFSPDAVKEMRLAPINLLKKIVNKKSSIYKEPPNRKANSEGNQKLVDFYTAKLSVDQVMMKGNRYYNLSSNCVIYTRPTAHGLCARVLPPYLYSIVPSQADQTIIESYVFSDFIEEGRVIPFKDLMPATGSEGFSRSRGTKSKDDEVASDEIDGSTKRSFIMWTNEQHFTTDESGQKIQLDKESGEEQYDNPIDVMPIVNLAQDRDNTPWAMQGGDMIDVSLAVQLALSDVLSIAKHQGFSLLSIVSEEEPRNLKIGLNRAIWLKATEGTPTPKIEYVQAQSPLDQYKAIILDLVALLLSTNDMSISSIGGSAQTKSITSGFQALIEMSDTLEIIEQQKPIMREAEKKLWEHISKWHNYLYDEDQLDDESRSLGKFTDDFEIAINYRDIKPIESEQERVGVVKDLTALKLMTKKDAVKKLNPDLTDEQVDEKLDELKEEYGEMDNESLVDKVKKADAESNSNLPSNEELLSKFKEMVQATEGGSSLSDKELLDRLNELSKEEMDQMQKAFGSNQ